MLYVCDLYLDNRSTSGKHGCNPWGEFFMEFKQYPTFKEVCYYIMENFPKEDVGIRSLRVCYAMLDGNYSKGFCTGLASSDDKWIIRPANIRALPKVRNKEKYLKNGGE